VLLSLINYSVIAELTKGTNKIQKYENVIHPQFSGSNPHPHIMQIIDTGITEIPIINAAIALSIILAPLV
jgi:hypothetical protein